MALEIERKFLVRSNEWRADVHETIPICQGYFCRTPVMSGRIRIYGGRGFVTFKSAPGTLVRHEYEYEIPATEAQEMLTRFSIDAVIVKQRHLLHYGALLWSVDVFEQKNAGLVLAEVELQEQGQRAATPPWAGLEVTEDPRYGNSNLAQTPYSAWAGLDA